MQNFHFTAHLVKISPLFDKNQFTEKPNQINRKIKFSKIKLYEGY